MKRAISSLLMIIMLVTLSGCGDDMYIQKHKYETYGILNEDDVKNPAVQYQVIWGNVIWGVVLIETIVAPIYFFGFSMWEPVGIKDASKFPPSELGIIG